MWSIFLGVPTWKKKFLSLEKNFDILSSWTAKQTKINNKETILPFRKKLYLGLNYLFKEFFMRNFGVVFWWNKENRRYLYNLFLQSKRTFSFCLCQNREKNERNSKESKQIFLEFFWKGDNLFTVYRAKSINFRAAKNLSSKSHLPTTTKKNRFFGVDFLTSRKYFQDFPKECVTFFSKTFYDFFFVCLKFKVTSYQNFI